MAIQNVEFQPCKYGEQNVVFFRGIPSTLNLAVPVTGPGKVLTLRNPGFQ